jgi:hypothetical protein
MSMLILDNIDIREYMEIVNAVKEARDLQQLKENTDSISAFLVPHYNPGLQPFGFS